jgi:hypothetical protein
MDSQEAVLKARTNNPRLIDGADVIEFTYPYTSAPGLAEAAENISEFVTIGGARRKQADSDKYRFTVNWFEPNNNVPERIYDLREGSGDRTVTVTYVHPISIVGRADFDASSGGKLICYIAGFRALRVGEQDSKQMYRCSLTLQEA